MTTMTTVSFFMNAPYKKEDKTRVRESLPKRRETDCRKHCLSNLTGTDCLAPYPYPTVRDHYGTEHFPCTHPECLAAKHIVFRTRAALAEHMLFEHKSKEKVKRRHRQRLNLEFRVRGSAHRDFDELGWQGELSAFASSSASAASAAATTAAAATAAATSSPWMVPSSAVGSSGVVGRQTASSSTSTSPSSSGSSPSSFLSASGGSSVAGGTRGTGVIEGVAAGGLGPGSGLGSSSWLSAGDWHQQHAGGGGGYDLQGEGEQKRKPASTASSWCSDTSVLDSGSQTGSVCDHFWSFKTNSTTSNT